MGTLKVLPDVFSPQLDNRRDVLVWLPPSYAEGQRRYPVIYMQDGQNLFDRATSFAGVEWQVDETLTALSREGLEAIVIGLNHAGEARTAEYSPFAGRPPGRGEQYVEFLTGTVKPMIDQTFRTLPDRDHTGLFGSSMGGLISLYGFFRRGDVFGWVGAMSPAFWVTGGAIYALVRQSAFVPGKIYLDHGSRENSAERMAALLREKGYQPGRELLYVVEEGGEHNEAAWARRLPAALRFLLRG
jgi:predicted alpha/beta superfamily hydrolase